MKIVHIIPYFYPAWAYGGTCRAAWELARALVRKGQSVVVYTTDALDENSRSTPASVVVDGVEIHRVRNISNHLAWRRAFLPFGLEVSSRNLCMMPMLYICTNFVPFRMQ